MLSLGWNPVPAFISCVIVGKKLAFPSLKISVKYKNLSQGGMRNNEKTLLSEINGIGTAGA